MSYKDKEKQREYMNKYRFDNQERIRANSKRSYWNNHKLRLEYNKKYRLNNKEKIRIKSRIYYLAHRERLKKATAEWQNKYKERRNYNARKNYIKHKHKVIKRTTAYSIEKYRTDIQYKFKVNLRTRIRKALKGYHNYSKASRTMKLVDCNKEELWKHLEKQFKLGMTRENYGEWHIDHIRPCASFDLRCPIGQLDCFHYTNLRPLWAHDNLSKGAKLLDLPSNS